MVISYDNNYYYMEQILLCIFRKILERTSWKIPIKFIQSSALYGTQVSILNHSYEPSFV